MALYRWLFVLVVMAIIFLLSNIPHLALFDSVMSASLRKLFHNYSMSLGGVGFFSYTINLHPDYLLHKFGHIILYGLLGAAVYIATGRSTLAAVLICIIFAVSDEYHQLFIPGRSSRFFDIVLDSVSALASILFLRNVLMNRERT